MNSKLITKDQVYDRLKTVMDPELHVDIVDLGLIYDVQIRQRVGALTRIHVKMTLTTPGCPLAPIIDKLIKQALEPLEAGEVVLDLVWEPAWNKDRMSDEAKLQLGMV